MYKRRKSDSVVAEKTPKIPSAVSFPGAPRLVLPPTEAIIPMGWTDEDDSMLRDAVLRHGEDWNVVREFIMRPEAKGTRSPRTTDECERRWHDVVAHKHKKVATWHNKALRLTFPRVHGRKMKMYLSASW